MNTSRQPLVNHLVGAVPLPPWGLALAAAVLLLLPLPLIGALQDPGVTGLWRLAMAPIVVAYVLGMHALLQQRWRQAIEALRPLARQPDLLDQALGAHRLGEAIALLCGTAIAVWIGESIQGTGWLQAYRLATYIAMFGLLGLSVFEGLRRTRHLKRIVAAGLALDLFDRQPLTPLARFGQSLSLTFVGGTCLSLVFQSVASLYSLQSLVIYAIFTAVALTLFFSSTWSIHVALVAAQEEELARVRRHWAEARDALRRRLAQPGAAPGPDEAAKLYEPLTVFGTYERQVLEASTWPFNPKIVKQVAASGVAPMLIYGIRLAIGLSG